MTSALAVARGGEAQFVCSMTRREEVPLSAACYRYSPTATHCRSPREGHHSLRAMPPALHGIVCLPGDRVLVRVTQCFAAWYWTSACVLRSVRELDATAYWWCNPCVCRAQRGRSAGAAPSRGRTSLLPAECSCRHIPWRSSGRSSVRCAVGVPRCCGFARAPCVTCV